MKSLYVTIPNDYNPRGSFFPAGCDYHRTDKECQEESIWAVERYDFDGTYDREVREKLDSNPYVKGYQIL